MRPRLLHIIDSLSVGGAELLLLNTLTLLPDYEHTVVYLQKPETLKDRIEATGARVLCINHSRWKDLPNSVRRLKEIVHQEKPWLIHSHLFYATLLARFAIPVSLPLVTTLHSSFGKDVFEKNRLSVWAERLTLKKRHHLIGVSEFVLKDYLRWVPFKGRKHVLYNFLPENAFVTQQRIEAATVCRCVAVGNLKEAKNYHYLLQVWEHLRENNIELHIYGKGHLEGDLEKIIKERRLNVKLCGQVGNINELLPGYHLFIQASEHEGFGLSVIEAMAAGVPVALSDIPVFREITGGNAHFFPLSGSNKVATKLLELCQNMENRISHVQQAYRYCRENYASLVYAEKLVSIYQSATGKRNLVHQDF